MSRLTKAIRKLSGRAPRAAAAPARIEGFKASPQANDGLFVTAYSRLLASCVGNDFQDNYDWHRFGPMPPAPAKSRQKPAGALGRLARRAGFIRIDSAGNLLAAAFRLVAPHFAELQWLYEQLQDQESRDLLVRLM